MEKVMFEQVEGGQQWTLTPDAQQMIKDCVAGYTVARKALQLVFPAYEMPEHKSIDKYYEDLAIAEDSPVPAFMQEEFKQKEEETKRYIGGLIGSY